MREDPDTSLEILRLLADEECYPSQLSGTDIAWQLGLADAEALLHLKYCVDSGLMEYHPDVDASTLNNPCALLPSLVQGLTPGGQDFVRQADAGEGKWWKKAKEQYEKAGVEATTSALSQMMQRLISTAIENAGL